MSEYLAFPARHNRVDFTASTAADAKSSGGFFLAADVYNPTAGVVYFQVHDEVNGSQSASTIVWSGAIPAGQARTIGAGWPIACDTAISFIVATTRDGQTAAGATTGMVLYS